MSLVVFPQWGIIFPNNPTPSEPSSPDILTPGAGCNIRVFGDTSYDENRTIGIKYSFTNIGV